MSSTPMMPSVPFLDHVFSQARTRSSFLDRPVPAEVLRQIYEHLKWGPTSMNCQPIRIQWRVSPQSRAELADCVNEGNKAKVLGAPVCAVIGMDINFASRLPTVFPHKKDAQSYYDGKPTFTEQTALRNSSLQGAYLIVIARALGLHCGPLSGFKADRVDELCWAGTTVRTNFLCNLGYVESDVDPSYARHPRLDYEDVCDTR
ncbi:malonic semialdehyde reductase [Ottowia thiooxydans]|uniref:malonic semialdehyde reductase n=1 Tax=Ottowia thiooxydans TaxID=219182 RepID=UPI0003FC28A4|nr:malonic semialdehyde reductase [Ottowia thiooxydans]